MRSGICTICRVFAVCLCVCTAYQCESFNYNNFQGQVWNRYVNNAGSSKPNFIWPLLQLYLIVRGIGYIDIATI